MASRPRISWLCSDSSDWIETSCAALPAWIGRLSTDRTGDSDAQFVAILTEAERRRQDPFIGIHAGERCEPRGPVAYLLMSHSHLADGLQALARVAVTALDRIGIDLDIGLDTVSVVIYPLRPDLRE